MTSCSELNYIEFLIILELVKSAFLGDAVQEYPGKTDLPPPFEKEYPLVLPYDAMARAFRQRIDVYPDFMKAATANVAEKLELAAQAQTREEERQALNAAGEANDILTDIIPVEIFKNHDLEFLYRIICQLLEAADVLEDGESPEGKTALLIDEYPPPPDLTGMTFEQS